jgi:hypothetical protein
MEMTNADIIKNYREAKDKRKQITILAHLNNCPVSKIKEILKKGGQLLPRGVIPEPETKSPDSPLLVKPEVPVSSVKRVGKPASYEKWLEDRQFERLNVLSVYLRQEIQELALIDQELLDEYQRLAKVLTEDSSDTNNDQKTLRKH